MLACLQAFSQGLGGGGGHRVPLRLRCVRRRRVSLAPFPRVMHGRGGVVKTRGDGVRGLRTPWERRTEAGAAAQPAGFAHANGPRRSRARETAQGSHQGLSEYGFLAVSKPEYGYIPEYVAEYLSMIVH